MKNRSEKHKNIAITAGSFIFAVCLFLTKCYLGNSILSLIFDSFSMVACFIVAVAYIKRKKFSRFFITFVIYLFILLLASLINSSASPLLVFKTYCFAMMVIMFFELVDFSKSYARFVIKGWRNAIYLLVFLNLLTIILYPNGMLSVSIYESNWLLGYDNVHICFFYTALLFMFIHNYLFDKRAGFIDIALIASIYVQVIYCFSANSLVSLLIFTLLIMLCNKRIISKICNVKLLYFIYLIADYLLVYLRLQEKIAWVIVGIFKKNIILSGRTVIWDRVSRLIPNSILFGYGQEPLGVITSKLGNPAFAHAHNTILDITYKTGIAGLVAQAMLHLEAARELYIYRAHILARKITVILLSFMALTIVEARQENINMYIILAISFGIGRVIKGAKNE